MNMLEASRIILGHRAVGWDDKSINDLILWNKNWRRTIQIQREKGIGKYRAIKVVSWRVNFSTDAIADFEGLLAVNREICKQQMSEKAPPDVPPYCAVFP